MMIDIATWMMLSRITRLWRRGEGGRSGLGGHYTAMQLHCRNPGTSLPSRGSPTIILGAAPAWVRRQIAWNMPASARATPSWSPIQNLRAKHVHLHLIGILATRAMDVRGTKERIIAPPAIAILGRRPG